MRGPYVIVCRGHSGGRVVAEALVRGGVHLGPLFPETNDTRFFAPGPNRFMREIVLGAFDYPDLNQEGKARYQDLLKRTFGEYVEKWVDDPEQPFGWKFGESVFAVPVILDTFPDARVVHVIRDGRDVMLSRLDARFGKLLDEPFNKVMVFGDPQVDRFLGRPVDLETVADFRNELEMTHWVTSVGYGLRGRAYPGRYLEVKYEDLCRDPVSEFEKIFSFLGLAFRPKVKGWVDQSVHAARVGKWRSLSPEQLARPLEIGGPLLKKLHYLSGE